MAASLPLTNGVDVSGSRPYWTQIGKTPLVYLRTISETPGVQIFVKASISIPAGR